MGNRRGFFGQLFTAGTGLLVGRKIAAAQQHVHDAGQLVSGGVPVPVETPDIPKLPYRLVDGVKEFHLSAEPVKTDFLPNRQVDVWGYNGSCPGPTIEVNEGDKVRILFHNNLPEMTGIHWHGLEVPMAMDGVPGLGQEPVQPGATYTYEFTLNQNGTFFYHSHFPMQEMMGQIGFFIVHPKMPNTPKVDRDFGIILQGWALLPNNTVPNTLAMEFNWLTMNGKAGPATTPLLAKHGERVRIRFVNLGMDHHPIHLHGNQFVVTGTEGGRIPQSAWYPGNTVLVGVAQARDVEFDAKYIGDWMIHCHLPHHMMNQMVSMVGPMSHRRDMGIAADPSALVPPQAGHEGHMTPSSAQSVPGYPQDMWMPMDEMVAGKPEVYGLRKSWTGAMMGMMTMIRVLPADLYDKIMDLKKNQNG